MIDSTGRRAIRANGTILDVLPVGRVVFCTGGLLVVLFTLVKPEASHGLGTAMRFVFWSLHVGVGLAALWVAGRILANGEHVPNNTVLSVLLTGCVGVVVAVPGYFLLDILFASLVVDPDVEAVSSSGMISLLAELQDVAPWFMVAWVLINLPVLIPQPDLGVRLEDRVALHAADNALASGQGNTTKQSSPALRVVADNRQEAHATYRNTLAKPATQKFLMSLSGVIGTDVIAVSSDLHYLNVWTVAGRTTVLGNLRDVVSELADTGMQVHRSHWVTHDHVRRIVGTSNNAACILSNELRIPVSRRRWKAVREQYGRGVLKQTESVNGQSRNG